MRVLLAVCFAIALDGVAWAQQHFDTRGVGLGSCAEYAELYQKSPEAIDNMYYSWAQGFISGVNAGLEKDFFDLNALTTDQMKRFIRQYCDAHPLASYRNAVGELMNSLPIILRQK
jgi:hypothetical protein